MRKGSLVVLVICEVLFNANAKEAPPFSKLQDATNKILNSKPNEKELRNFIEEIELGKMSLTHQAKLYHKINDYIDKNKELVSL